MRRLALLLACVGAAALNGCGGSSPYAAQTDGSPQLDETHEVALMSEGVRDLDGELVDELSELGPSSVPDGAERCEEACNLCFNICDLRERICTIAVEHPENGVLSGQCVDASVRCKRGTRDTDAVCDCSQVELRIRI